MKPHPKTVREKQTLSLRRELKALYPRIHYPESVSLEKPIQRGWIRHYVLTQEAMHRPDANILRDILRAIGTFARHWRKDFKLGRRTRKGMVEIDQGIRTISADEWQRKPLSYPDSWLPYFSREFRKPDWLTRKVWHHESQWLYVFSTPQLFALKVEPFWLTHYKTIDTAAIQRAAEIDSWLLHHSGGAIYRKLKSHRSDKYRVQDKVRLIHLKERAAKQRLFNFNLTETEAEMRSPIFLYRYFISASSFTSASKISSTQLAADPVILLP